MGRAALCLLAIFLIVRPAAAEEIDCSSQSTAQLAAAFGFRCHSGFRARDPAVPPASVARMVDRIAPQREIDPKLVLAIIAAESDFDVYAVSPRNAKGLMQLMPETAERFAVGDPFNAEQNIRGGATYIGVLLKQFGDLKLALAAYNAGEAAVLAYGDVPPFVETQDYVARVTAYYASYKRGNPTHRAGTDAEAVPPKR